MRNEFVLYPNATAILTVPFWLPSAPRPLLRAPREHMLKKAVAELNKRSGPAGIGVRWELVELAWSREPQSVRAPKIWHPKSAANRKGAVLKGTLLNDEAFGFGPAPCDIKIIERAILYYDYGICSLEYVFALAPAGSGDMAWLGSASFWNNFKARVMEAVEHKELGALMEPRWQVLQARMVDALALGHAAVEDQFPNPLNSVRRKYKWLERLRRGTATSQNLSLQAGMVPIDKIFGLHRPAARYELNGHICASFGINFVLFAAQEAGSSDDAGEPISETIKSILGGRPIGKKSGKLDARSDHLAAMYYGAVHTLAIVRGAPASADAIATVGAARALLRYLWMGYGTLAEASRGLMALQGEYYLGYRSPRLRRARLIRKMVKNLELAGQISQLLIAEFHFSMFWESEIEYDIYHAAYQQWRMTELFQFVQDNLAALGKTAEVLRRGIEDRRQRWISRLLAAIAALTIITAVEDFFELSEWKPVWLRINHPFHEEWRDLTTIIVLVVLVVFVSITFWLSDDGDERN